MKDLWKQLEGFLRQHAPAVLQTLNPPATDKQIKEAESKLNLTLPADLVASLQVHNGQLQETGHPPRSSPLVPAEYSKQGSYLGTWGELAPLDLIVNSTLRERQGIPILGADAGRFRYLGAVRRNGKWNWIDFVDPGSGDRIGLDLNPAPRGQMGQVISIIHDPDSLFVLAPGYRKWFEMLIERYEAGRYYFRSDESESREPMDRFNPDSQDDDNWDV